MTKIEGLGILYDYAYGLESVTLSSQYANISSKLVVALRPLMRLNHLSFALATEMQSLQRFLGGVRCRCAYRRAKKEPGGVMRSRLLLLRLLLLI